MPKSKGAFTLTMFLHASFFYVNSYEQHSQSMNLLMSIINRQNFKK